MRTPSASSTSAEPQRDDTARLPCLAIGTPGARGHEGRRGRDVEGLGAVATGTAGVDQAVAGGDRRGHVGAHRPGTAGDLVRRLALHPQRHHEPGDLGLAGVAAHDLHHGRVGLLARQVVALDQLL